MFLPDKQDVYLGVYLLNQYLETDCFPSVFPIMIQQRMRFKKVILTFSLLNREVEILLSEDHLVVLTENTIIIKLFYKPLFKKFLEGTSVQCRIIVGRLAFVGQVRARFCHPKAKPPGDDVFCSGNSHGVFQLEQIEHFLNILGAVRGSCITFMTGIIDKLADLRNKFF